MTKWTVLSTVAVVIVLAATSTVPGQFVARDPGVRSGAAGAGASLDGLSAGERAVFDAGLGAFLKEHTIASGLGPRFNLDSCAGCHAQPATGGSSPAVNPQIAIATAFGARNSVPSFLLADGPVREVRVRYHADGTRDGGVQALFTIAGRIDAIDASGDASGCAAPQEDFEAHLALGNLSFRIPAPVFGLGLVEHIPDAVILANRAADAPEKTALGITGTVNRNGNDGTIARFGWKAHNKSLLLFAAEAYNVEQGISSALFPTERDETPGCQHGPTPNDSTNLDGTSAVDVLSGIQKLAAFMRFLAPPTPSLDQPGGRASIRRGQALFARIGCALCHTPVLRTGSSSVAALREQPVALYSDLLLHNMGPGLADDIVQGDARGDEFRTAPLWGLGHRIFFLHDGRTRDLHEAITAHASPGTRTFRASEANAVVRKFSRLSEAQKQDLFNFLRSL